MVVGFHLVEGVLAPLENLEEVVLVVRGAVGVEGLALLLKHPNLETNLGLGVEGVGVTVSHPLLVMQLVVGVPAAKVDPPSLVHAHSLTHSLIRPGVRSSQIMLSYTVFDHSSSVWGGKVPYVLVQDIIRSTVPSCTSSSGEGSAHI